MIRIVILAAQGDNDNQILPSFPTLGNAIAFSGFFVGGADIV